MKLSKAISTTALAIGLSFAASGHAATITIEGEMADGDGLLGALLPPGTAITGSLEWNGSLDDVKISTGGLCFTGDASGMPSTSPGCGSPTATAVPILPTGEINYNGTPAAPGATFEQAGTTFDGDSGLLKITSFSPAEGVPIFFDLWFYSDGTGSLAVYTDYLGDLEGSFTYSAVPVPAAAWLFGSALLGLAGIARKRQAD